VNYTFSSSAIHSNWIQGKASNPILINYLFFDAREYNLIRIEQWVVF